MVYLKANNISFSSYKGQSIVQICIDRKINMYKNGHQTIKKPITHYECN